MQAILKSLVSAQNPRLWNDYQRHFRPFFEGKNPHYDWCVELIQDYNNQFGLMLNAEVLLYETQKENSEERRKWLEGIWSDSRIETVSDPVTFLALCAKYQRAEFELSIDQQISKFQSSRTRDVSLPKLQTLLTDFTTGLHTSALKLSAADAPTTISLIGLEAQQAFKDYYAKLEEQANSDQELYYTLPFSHYEDVQIKRGDLVFFNAFTSQGKSVMLRFFCYHLLIHYGLNVGFWTFEMQADVVHTLFLVMHGNNKKIFPNTPRLLYNDVKHGRLDPEQKEFLTEVVNKDFTENENYGTLIIEKPKKTRFSMMDLAQQVSIMESTKMRLHVLALDYLTLMFPLMSERGRPDMHDYNQLIKDIKQFSLSHRNRMGEESPLITLTAAQIARDPYENALKKDCRYELSNASANYSEIERSADVLFTSIMPPEMARDNRIRMQNHKNRDGAVIHDPLDLYIDLAGGYSLEEISSMTERNTIKALQSLSI